MSSPHAEIDNGEGSSTGPAPMANPSTPLTALVYLRSVERLPRLIKAWLHIPEEVSRLPPLLCNAPIKRELSYHPYKTLEDKTKVDFDPADNTHIGTTKMPYNAYALFVYVTGDELKDEEACCNMAGSPKCQGGIFPLSVVPIKGVYSKNFPSDKACANCQYNGMGSKCPLQTACAAAYNNGQAEVLDGESLSDVPDDYDNDDPDDSTYDPDA